MIYRGDRMSFLKKMDRVLHRKEYQQYKNQLQMHHSSTKQLKDLIAQKEAMYNKYKFSANAGELRNELDDLYKQYDYHSEMLDHLKDNGLKALKVTPEELRQRKREANLYVNGVAGGAIAGSLGTIGLQHMFESSGLFEQAKSKFGPKKE